MRSTRRPVPTPKITLIDSDQSTRKLLQWTLPRTMDCVLDLLTDWRDIPHAGAGRPDVVLWGIPLDEAEVREAWTGLRKKTPQPPVILLTSRDHAALAADLCERGAHDYFIKPIDLRRLRLAVLAALRQTELKRQLRDLRSQLRRMRSSHPADALYSMDEAKAEAVRMALVHSGGNVRNAARLLGIGRTTIYKLMRRHGITKSSTGSDEWV